jgi:hypothetical protein
MRARIFSSWSPTGDVWWRHFRSKGPTRANIAQLPVAHVRTFPREPLWSHVTFDDVTSSEKAPLGVDIAYIPVVHARTLRRETPSGSRDVTSGSHVDHVQWYILYYYNSKKIAREPVTHAHAITSGQARFWWRLFLSCAMVRSSLMIFPKYGFVRPDILLIVVCNTHCVWFFTVLFIFCLVYTMLPVSLDCPSLIVLWYSLSFI